MPGAAVEKPVPRTVTFPPDGAVTLTRGPPVAGVDGELDGSSVGVGVGVGAGVDGSSVGDGVGVGVGAGVDGSSVGDGVGVGVGAGVDGSSVGVGSGAKESSTLASCEVSVIPWPWALEENTE